MKMQKWLKWTILSLLAIGLILAIEKCSDNRSNASRLTTLLEIKEREAEKFRTESGLWAAKAEQAQASLGDFKALYASEIRKLRKELRMKPRSITEYVEVYIEGNDTVYLTRVMDNFVSVDTSMDREVRYEYKDKWNDFTAWAIGKSIGLDYNIRDSLAIVTTYDGGFLKRGRYSTTVMSSNPAITIMGVKSVAIRERVKRFGIGPQIGIGLDRDFKPVPYVGVGISYSLLRF